MGVNFDESAPDLTAVNFRKFLWLTAVRGAPRPSRRVYNPARAARSGSKC